MNLVSAAPFFRELTVVSKLNGAFFAAICADRRKLLPSQPVARPAEVKRLQVWRLAGKSTNAMEQLVRQKVPFT
jgi:hypothetical protein